MHSSRKKVVPVRLPWEMVARIEAEVKKSRPRSNWAPKVNLSSWIRAAIKEKFQHLDRGRKKCNTVPIGETAD